MSDDRSVVTDPTVPTPISEILFSAVQAAGTVAVSVSTGAESGIRPTPGVFEIGAERSPVDRAA
jgi:hypothetical protein